MASPFTVFRKNQKVLLAITGILAMIAFVFLGTCSQTIGPAQAYQNPTVVSWKFGEIDEAEMASRMQMRVILNKFLQDAVQRSRGGMGVPQIFPQTEDAIMRSLVLARRGGEMGLVVSDDVVNRALAGLTNNRLRPVEFEQLAANYYLGGQRVTPKMIFDALREELLADNVRTLFRGAMGADTPAQRWDYYKRFEQRMTAQVMPVPVAEFTKEVKPPSDKELQELFDKYKDSYYQPGSPEPGFRQPYKVRFQYFRAEIEPLITAEIARIPEEEIREYYEKNKDTQFRATKLSPLDEPKKDDGAKKEDSTKDEGTKDDSTKKEDSQKTENAAKDEDAKKEDAKKDAAKTGIDDAAKEPTDSAGDKAPDNGAKRDAAGKADSKSSKSDGGDPKSGDAKNDANPAQATRTRAAAPFQLVRFQDDKAKDDPAAAKDTAAKDTAAKDETSKDAGAKDAAPNDDTAKGDTAKGDTAKDDAAKGDAAKADAAKKDAPAEPVEYRPLEKVREEIARTLARQRVQERIDERLKKLRDEMVRYADRRTRWKIDQATNPDEPEPKRLDMQALAQDQRVKFFDAEWLSQNDAVLAADLEIAKSRVMDVSSPHQFYRPWVDIMFEPKGLYRPITTRLPPGGDSFLSWKIDEREGHIPEFAEVREQVLEAYQRIHARGFARKQAEAYAKTVRDAKLKMKEVFAQDNNLPVKEVGPFPWLTRPNVPFTMMQQTPPPQFSAIPGVENPGDEFMRTAFSLSPGEVGVAFNHPQSIAYVIQAVSFDPSDRVLEQEFMVRMKNYERYRAAGNDELINAETSWMESLLSQYGVHWHRPPEVRMASLD